MPVERYFLLIDGHIRVIRTTPDGDQIIVLHIAPGQLFGIGAAFGRTTYPATAMTADDCLALAWPNRLWGTFTERYDGFATESYRVIGERVGEMNNRIVDWQRRRWNSAWPVPFCDWSPRQGARWRGAPSAACSAGGSVTAL